jgi:hypothetical protein
VGPGGRGGHRLGSALVIRLVAAILVDVAALQTVGNVSARTSSPWGITSAPTAPFHYLARYEPDGADLALLDVLQHEDVAERFTHVVIGSGDHLFAEEAACLAAQQVCVTVVRRCRSLPGKRMR